MFNRMLLHLDDPQARHQRRINTLSDQLQQLLPDEAVVFTTTSNNLYCCVEHILPMTDLDDPASQAAAWLRELALRIADAAERLAESGS